MLSGVALASTSLLSQVYGPLYLLFLLASLVPQLLSMLAENGPLNALRETAVSLLSGAPVFFAFQSRCIGHHLADEFSSGGATYIATGRGVALCRQPFSTLYASFAQPCLYPGLELAAMLLVAPIVAPSISESVHPLTWLAAAVTPFALLFAPSLFNPRSFELRLALRDTRAWLSWLLNSDPAAKSGWRAYHDARVAKRSAVAPHSFLIPSREILLSLTFLLLAIEAMRGFGWRSALLAPVIVVPVVPFVAAVLSFACARLHHCCTLSTQAADKQRQVQQRRTLHISGIVLMLSGLCAEVVALRVIHPSLPPAHWVVLATTRYFSWRSVANFASCVPKGNDVGSCLPHGLGLALLAVNKQSLASIAAIGDCALGALLLLPMLLLSLLPCVPMLHIPCLLHTSGHQLRRAQTEHVESQKRLGDAWQAFDKKKALWKRAGAGQVKAALRNSFVHQSDPSRTASLKKFQTRRTQLVGTLTV